MPFHWRDLRRYFIVSYTPNPNARDFLAEALEQTRGGLTVRVAVPSATDGRAFFGVPLARHGVQPVWVDVTNATPRPYRLQCIALDPNYFSPLEAAAVCHYSGLKRLLGFGLLAWVFLPLLLLAAAKLLSVGRANRRMDAFFREQAFRLRPIAPGTTQVGFVYAPRTEGTKTVRVRLLGPDGGEDFDFAVPGRELRADYQRRLETEQVGGPELDPD